MRNKAFFVKFNGDNAEQHAAHLQEWLGTTFAPESYSISEVPPVSNEDAVEVLTSAYADDEADDGHTCSEEKAAA